MDDDFESIPLVRIADALESIARSLFLLTQPPMIVPPGDIKEQ